ncbi:MAG: hypothetical protein QW650_00200 [Thermofilum sp.]
MSGEVQPVLSVTPDDIAQLRRMYDMFRELQKQVLEEGVDYGYPAGKKAPGQKPSLYKSGAEKLTRLFNLTPHFEIVEAVERDDFVMYTFKCTLQAASGKIVGEGFGSCNSKEKRAWSENPWAFQNNILKIAKKRAHVDAVLTGLGASNVFTQDLEDEEKEPSPQRTDRATHTQLSYLHDLAEAFAAEAKLSLEQVLDDICKRYGVDGLEQLSRQQASEIIDELKGLLRQKAERR